MSSRRSSRSREEASEVEQEQLSGGALQEEQQVRGGGLEEEEEQLGGGTLKEEQQVRGGGLEEDQEQLSGGALEDEVRGSGLRARCGSPGGADLLPWMRERERGRKK
jgi:hypothetical protein